MTKFYASGLQNIMLEKNISINELAIISKINSHVIQQLIDGSIEISSKNIITLRNVLNISFEYLIFNERREPIIIDVLKLSNNQLIELLFLQSNFKKIPLKNPYSYTIKLKTAALKGDIGLPTKYGLIRKYLLGLTQEQFSSLLNVSKTSVYSWESGSSKPTFSRLFTIAKMTGFTIDSLYQDGNFFEISAFGLTDEMYDILKRIIQSYLKM